jgi:hypothetical protein
VRIGAAIATLRLIGFLAAVAPKPPKPNTVGLEERLAAFPTRVLPIRRAVQIRWNKHQVPFIRAERDHDLAVALGAVHAPPDLRVVPAGTFAAWMKSRGKLGGQHKVPRIIADPVLFESLGAAADRQRNRSR